MKFKEVAKDRLFYDRWLYSMRFYLEEASALRDLDHETIDQIIEARIKWRQIRQQRWSSRSSILISGAPKNNINQQCIENLHALADQLISCEQDFKYVVSFNTMWIYACDTDVFEKINSLPFIKHAVYSQAVINRPRDVVVLRKSQHNHRTYFKNVKLTAQEKETLVNFLKNSQEHVRVSPGMLSWMDNVFLRTQDYFFVDHADSAWLTMLSLVRPGLIRKTQQIQQAK